MPGPAPKPADRRQRRNKARIEIVSQRDEAPKPPTGWLKATRDKWAAYWTSPIAQLIDDDTDRPMIERLFHLYDEWERARRGYRKERLVEGSKGQPVINPLRKVMSNLESEIRQLEDRLGLSPKARLQLGAKFGEAARSLDELNRALQGDDDEDPYEDPRLQAVE